MTDMPTDFWAGWITVITLVSLAGLGWLIFSIYFTTESPEEHSGGPVWDETLREGSNPAPLWWFWMILALLVISVVYLMLYPGLGSFSGALRWSQGGRFDANVNAYEAEFGGIRELVADARLEVLQDNPALMKSAQSIFARQCAVCHGYEAEGQADLFPNLMDNHWQWGGAPTQIEQSIRAGRIGIMVGWSAVLGDDGVAQLASYVKMLATQPGDNHPGQTPYTQFCSACHGPDGSGNAILGAPSLLSGVYLYGGSDAAIEHTIALGRTGEMPAFAQRLDETQIKLLVALLSQDTTQ
ncbi:MAG: cytochrome-c oxidase, cbb3-type subunit III [Gammaproteobacteria bacterium]